MWPSHSPQQGARCCPSWHTAQAPLILIGERQCDGRKGGCGWILGVLPRVASLVMLCSPIAFLGEGIVVISGSFDLFGEGHVVALLGVSGPITLLG